MTATPAIATAISIGLLGSTHCIGMCGGITSALSLSLKGRSQTETTGLMLAYHAGRISSYALAGLLLGIAGWYLGDASEALQSSLRILASAMLIAMGLYITGWWQGLMTMEKLGQSLWKHIQPVASQLLPIRNAPNALALGALWGWLPCGLVYSTLIWSASQNNPVQSALLMAAFGLGTLPGVFLTGLFARQLVSFMQASATRNMAGIMMILFGLYSIPGAHQMGVMSALSIMKTQLIELGRHGPISG